MTIKNIAARSAEHPHESGSISADEALLCPTCFQPITQEQFEQIQVRIEGEERARAAKIERTLHARFAGEMAKVEATKKAEVEKARKDAAAQIEKAKDLTRNNRVRVVLVALERWCSSSRPGRYVAEC